jgi:hypothetical protein
MKEFVNPTMVPFVLPNVLLVTENCSKEEFSQHILQHLKPVMKMQDPIQVITLFTSSLPYRRDMLTLMNLLVPRVRAYVKYLGKDD